MTQFSRRRRGCVLTVTAAVIVATPLAAAPAAHAAGGRTVTQWLATSTRVTVHDPGDRLGRPGDTHELSLDIHDVDDDHGPGALHITSYDCGPHDPARTPEELGCATVGYDELVAGESTSTLRNSSIRWRVTTEAGPLRLRLTGGGFGQRLQRESLHAEGTRYESSREVVSLRTGSAVTGTFAGLALTQPAAWRDETRTNGSRVETRVWRGPAVPLPDLPPAGTGVLDDESIGRASVTWVRPLPDRTALYGHVWAEAAADTSRFGPLASAVVSRQRCQPGEIPLGLGEQPAPGRCDALEWLANDGMEPPWAFPFDNRLGTARLTGRSSTERNTQRPQEFHAVTASWQGSQPVGYRTVDRFWDADGRPETTTTSGVRWLRPTAQATWDGRPVQVTEVTMHADHTQLTGS
jgi:hypothetical protein